MRLSGHQPVYLPGIILFTKIALSDEFMFVGHCDAGDGSWHNRNYIRGARLTVPIKHGGESINATEIDGSHWKRKHLRSIELQYSKRPYFHIYFDKLKELIEMDWRTLGPLNMALIELFCIWLRLTSEITDSRDYKITGNKTEMLISMCEESGASEYLSNEGARAYVDELKMSRSGIRHRWMKFEHPIYDQGDPEFITNLSIIDLLFNCGPEAARIVREAGSVG